MKKSVGMVAIVAALGIGSAMAADVGVSVSVGEPGFYGRIDIGSMPQPELIYSAPLIIESVRGAARPPVYLHVPPGHEKHWDKHCHRYGACGVPVYFVQDRWYNDVYVKQRAHTHEYGRGDRDEGHGHKGKGHSHDKGHQGGGHGHGRD